jgi:uncharacterized protein (TIGR02996 family)
VEEQAFVNEIFANPESDDALQVYADWLEDQGEADRARLIRVELEQETLRTDDPRRDAMREEETQLRERCAKALPVPRALRKKMTFGWSRGLAFAGVNRDAHVTDADLRELARFPALKTLNYFELLPAERLAQLPLCPNVQELAYCGTRSLTDEDWQALVSLSQVERLSLTSNKIAAGVRLLAAMPQLKELDLSEAPVGNAELAHLAALKDLEILKLYPYDGDGEVTDAGLESISSLRKLRVLSVPYNDRITDAGLPHLLQLKELTSLNLSETGIEGDPVPVLVRLKKLRYLGLGSLEGVNDQNLKELARRLPALRELDLRRTSVTRFRLAQLLPKTKWKKIQMETSLDVYNTPEEAEIEAFEQFCREHDVFVEVDQE